MGFGGFRCEGCWVYGLGVFSFRFTGWGSGFLVKELRV